jgi:hypothetical protein
MSEDSPRMDAGDEKARDTIFAEASSCSRQRRWSSPVLTAHTTLTTLTQSALPQPLSLLFLQSSAQCFNNRGVPVPCPPV